MSYSRRLISGDGHCHVQHSEKQLKIPHFLSNAAPGFPSPQRRPTAGDKHCSSQGMLWKCSRVIPQTKGTRVICIRRGGSVTLVSSVAHLRDGNRAVTVWNEHSSSVLPSRWGKGKKKWWWHFSSLHNDNGNLEHNIQTVALFVKPKSYTVTFVELSSHGNKS